jgi:hypothetical protein
MPTIDHIGVFAQNRQCGKPLAASGVWSVKLAAAILAALSSAQRQVERPTTKFAPTSSSSARPGNEIKHKHDERKAPSILHRDLNLVERILRDYVSDDFHRHLD